MNDPQSYWWGQASSDHSILLLLRREGSARCHQLHYLQMVTEKLAKAYFWRTGNPPKRSHVGFVKFLQALDNRSRPERSRIARLLGFDKADAFEHWIPQITGSAYRLERLAPDLAGDGPNPEYPRPTAMPANAPASFKFTVWDDLTKTSNGRRLLKLIDRAVIQFPQYG